MVFERKSQIRSENLNRTQTYASSLTSVAWFLGIIAFIGSMLLAFYLFSPEDSDKIFGFTSLLEGFFSLAGLCLIDPLFDKPFRIKPKRFKPINTEKFLFPLAVNLGGLLLVQIMFQFPLTVKTWQKCLAIWFAGISEEFFFRGFLLQLFINISKGSGFKQYNLGFANPFDKEKQVSIISFSLFDLLGLVVSIIAFTFLHFNYYGNPIMLGIVACSGAILGITYLKYQNLTANIIAHLFLNFIVTIQVFYLLNF